MSNETARIEQLERALRDIHAAVCGDKHPRWSNDSATYHSRGWIAGHVGAVLAAAGERHE